MVKYYPKQKAILCFFFLYTCFKDVVPFLLNDTPEYGIGHVKRRIPYSDYVVGLHILWQQLFGMLVEKADFEHVTLRLHSVCHVNVAQRITDEDHIGAIFDKLSRVGVVE